MALSSMLPRRCSLIALAFFGFLCGHSHANDGQTTDSGKLYEQNSRWFIIGGVNGKACGLTIPHGRDEMLFVTAELERGQVLFYFAYLKTKLYISMQGNYRSEIKFSNGDFFIRNAKPLEEGDHSGISIQKLSSDFISDFSSSSSFVMKIGDVVYGTYDLSRSRDGIPRLFNCMADTAKWDITSSMQLRSQLNP